MQTKTMLRKHALLFIFLLLTVNSTVIYAASYSVEYIVFENTQGTTEPWTKGALQMPSNAINLNASQGNGFRPLKSSQLRLHAVANKLKRLSSYTVVAHGGWIQPLKARRLQPVQVSQQQASSRVNGTITFHQKKYLHLNLNLQLTDLNSLINYRLKATKRIKADEIHYFDHPRFSVLARVRKLN